MMPEDLEFDRDQGEYLEKADRDLKAMVDKGAFVVGTAGGRSTYYDLNFQ